MTLFTLIQLLVKISKFSRKFNKDVNKNKVYSTKAFLEIKTLAKNEFNQFLAQAALRKSQRWTSM